MTALFVSFFLYLYHYFLFRVYYRLLAFVRSNLGYLLFDFLKFYCHKSFAVSKVIINTNPRFKFKLFSVRKSKPCSVICPNSDTLCNCVCRTNLCISLVFSEVFLFASVILFYKFFTSVSDSFILLVLFPLLTLFEFLIIEFLVFFLQQSIDTFNFNQFVF